MTIKNAWLGFSLPAVLASDSEKAIKKQSKRVYIKKNPGGF